MTWDDAQIARLKELAAHPDKLSDTEIAKRMVWPSRNAVIGARHRLGIQLLGRGRVEPRKPRAQTKTRDVKCEPLHLTFAQKATGQCSYPYGDGPFTFCCLPVVEGYSYCRAHKELCLVKPIKPAKPFHSNKGTRGMTQLAKATPSQRLFHAAHVERRRRFFAPIAAPIIAEPAAKPVEPAAEPTSALPSFNRIAHIQTVVARSYGVTRSHLTGSRRTADKMRPRQVAMYLARTILKKSMPEIGRRFGGRDHTTVLHAVRKIERLIQVDQKLAEQVATLKAALEARHDRGDALLLMASRTLLSEAELQMQVVALLAAYGRADIEWHHCPNGEERHKGVAKRLKLMGVTKGVADLMLLIDGRCYGVELKTEIGTQSGAQADWQERFERAGGSYHLAKGLDEAVGVLLGLNAFRPGFTFNTQLGGRVVRSTAKARVSNAPWKDRARAG